MTEKNLVVLVVVHQ